MSYGNRRTPRGKAFEKPPDPAWLPQKGELVFVKRGLTCYGTVIWCTFGVVCVELAYGHKRFKRQYLVTDTRPVEGR